MSTISRQRSYLRRGSRGTDRGGVRAAAQIPPFGPSGRDPLSVADPSLVTHPAQGVIDPTLSTHLGEAPRSLPVLGYPSHHSASERGGSSPSGNTPALADARPEAITATEDAVVAEIQGRVLLLEGDNDTLQVEVRALQEENAKVREDVAGLRLTVADLEALLMRELVSTSDGDKKDPKIKDKKSSPKSGDVRNRLSAKQRKLALELASSEDDTSEEEEELLVSSVAKGPVVPGLTELTTRRPEFRDLLSYRHYRLANTTQRADAAISGKLNSQLKRMKYHIDTKFSGDPAIQVLDFLKTFRDAADMNELSEAAAAVLLPYFLEGKAKTGLATRMKRIPAAMPKYPAAVQWLLQSFASETIIAAAHQRVYTARQALDEDEEQFASRLTRYAGDAGSVFSEDALIAAFVDGLHPFASNTIRGQVNATMTFAEVQLLAEQAGNASRALEKNQKNPTRAGNIPMLPIRARPVVAAMADSHHRDPEMYADRSPLSVQSDYGQAAHGYASSGQAVYATDVGYPAEPSLLGGASSRSPSSELSSMSAPSRGWASVTELENPYHPGVDISMEEAFAVDSRGRTCHLCLDPSHFLMDCPMLGNEVRAAAQAKRDAKYGTLPNRMQPPTYPYRRAPAPPSVRTSRPPGPSIYSSPAQDRPNPPTTKVHPIPNLHNGATTELPAQNSKNEQGDT
jgi:hypothetical protein